MAPCPVHHQDPTPLHPEQGYSPNPGQCREEAVQHHIARELPSTGSSPRHPTKKLDQEKDGDDQLEAVEARARDELGLHRRAVFLVEHAVEGAEEEGDGEEDGGDECEVEAGGNAFIHPGVGDGGVGFAVAVHEQHGCGYKERRDAEKH